mmetsp:Transcript_65443/g.155052  ORF Transcript_65443/g.155052 Transcript_65443/m.155052 type:complete len:748 (-) Transcript_65443:771-3014(-)
MVSLRVTFARTEIALRRTACRLLCMLATSVGRRSRSWPSRDASAEGLFEICISWSSADSLSSTRPVAAMPSSIGPPPRATSLDPPSVPSLSTLTRTCMARCRAISSGWCLLACTSAFSSPICRKRCRVCSASHSAEIAAIADAPPASLSITTRRRSVVSSTWTLAASIALVRFASASAAAIAVPPSACSPTTEVSACAPPARWNASAWFLSVTSCATALQTPSLTPAPELGLKSSSISIVSPFDRVMMSQKRSSQHTPPIATTALARRESLRDVESIESSRCTESCLRSSSRQRTSEHSPAMISAAISAVPSSWDARFLTRVGRTSGRSSESFPRGSEDLARDTRQRSAESEIALSDDAACWSTATSPRASAMTSHTSWSSHRFASTCSAGPTLADMLINLASSAEMPRMSERDSEVPLMQSSIRDVPPISKSAPRHSFEKDVSVERRCRQTSTSEMWLSGVAAIDARTPTPWFWISASRTTSTDTDARKKLRASVRTAAMPSAPPVRCSSASSFGIAPAAASERAKRSSAEDAERMIDVTILRMSTLEKSSRSGVSIVMCWFVRCWHTEASALIVDSTLRAFWRMRPPYAGRIVKSAATAPVSKMARRAACSETIRARIVVVFVSTVWFLVVRSAARVKMPWFSRIVLRYCAPAFANTSRNETMTACPSSDSAGSTLMMVTRPFISTMACRTISSPLRHVSPRAAWRRRMSWSDARRPMRIGTTPASMTAGRNRSTLAMFENARIA